LINWLFIAVKVNLYIDLLHLSNLERCGSADEN